MDAARAEDAVGIECALQLLVHGKQPRRELLDAVTIVAAAEQGRMAACLVRQIESLRRIEIRRRIQRRLPFHSISCAPRSSGAAVGLIEKRHKAGAPPKSGWVCSRIDFQNTAASSTRSPPSLLCEAVTAAAAPDKRTYKDPST